MRRPLACLALLLASLQAGAADLSIMPVSIQLDRSHDRTTVQVTNQGSEPVVLQAEAIAWKREGGIDSDAPTSDLIVNPPVFTVAPGRTQIVRVGLRRSGTAEQEMTYRMVLREVPPAAVEAAQVQGQVRVLVALRVPVYVAPSAVRREERWHARYDAEGNLVAQVTNSGNVHYKVGSLRVQGDTGQATVAQGPGSVLFPGEVRSFRVHAPAKPADAQPLTLEVLTELGMQHVPLDIAQN